MSLKEDSKSLSYALEVAKKELATIRAEKDAHAAQCDACDTEIRRWLPYTIRFLFPLFFSPCPPLPPPPPPPPPLPSTIVNFTTVQLSTTAMISSCLRAEDIKCSFCPCVC